MGVDVFFVISGYLIGRHLLQDIQARRFSILGFYAKRARRIFPALALLLIAVWAVGWLVFSAPELPALGQQIVASAFFSNNVLLWLQSGYFDAAALDKPPLHLWSLGNRRTNSICSSLQCCGWAARDRQVLSDGWLDSGRFLYSRP